MDIQVQIRRNAEQVRRLPDSGSLSSARHFFFRFFFRALAPRRIPPGVAPTQMAAAMKDLADWEDDIVDKDTKLKKQPEGAKKGAAPIRSSGGAVTSGASGQGAKKGKKKKKKPKATAEPEPKEPDMVSARGSNRNRACARRNPIAAPFTPACAALSARDGRRRGPTRPGDSCAARSARTGRAAT